MHTSPIYRVIMGMYAIGGLELLGVLDETVSEANRKDWIEWIYAQQRIPSTTGEDSGKMRALSSFCSFFFSHETTLRALSSLSLPPISNTSSS